MKNLAIIPARGGSKRIPKKNIRDFLGKPIIAYSIETALNSSLFEEVMVSTDDEGISEIAQKIGAKVPFLRSNKNADDYSTLADVMDEVIFMYKEKGLMYEFACCILPTSPLLSIDNLKKGLSLLKESSFDSVRPVVKYNYPIQRAFYMEEETGKVEFVNSGFSRSRSQDTKTTYHDTGQFYWFRPEIGLKSNNRGAFEISELEYQDIDNPDDWKMAELKFQYLHNKI